MKKKYPNNCGFVDEEGYICIQKRPCPYHTPYRTRVTNTAPRVVQSRYGKTK